MVLVTATIEKDEALYRHAGNYTCVATSGIGAMSTVGETFEVTVKGKAATNSLTIDLLELFKLLSIMRGKLSVSQIALFSQSATGFAFQKMSLQRRADPNRRLPGQWAPAAKRSFRVLLLRNVEEAHNLYQTSCHTSIGKVFFESLNICACARVCVCACEIEKKCMHAAGDAGSLEEKKNNQKERRRQRETVMIGLSSTRTTIKVFAIRSNTLRFLELFKNDFKGGSSGCLGSSASKRKKSWLLIAKPLGKPY